MNYMLKIKHVTFAALGLILAFSSPAARAADPDELMQGSMEAGVPVSCGQAIALFQHMQLRYGVPPRDFEIGLIVSSWMDLDKDAQALAPPWQPIAGRMLAEFDKSRSSIISYCVANPAESFWKAVYLPYNEARKQLDNH